MKLITTIQLAPFNFSHLNVIMTCNRVKNVEHRKYQVISNGYELLFIGTESYVQKLLDSELITRLRV